MSHEIITNGYHLFKSALLPAVLLENGTSGKTNSTILGSWLVASRINVNELLTPDAVSAALRQAAEATYSRLLWKVQPARLVAEIANSKGINLSKVESEGLFADKVRADEAKKAQEKADAAAQKAVQGIIASLQLNSARKTEQFRVALTARVSREQQFGTSWPDIEKDIRSKVDEIYRASERENEFVGVYRDLLSEVKV
jgi:hypothetical protein